MYEMKIYSTLACWSLVDRLFILLTYGEHLHDPGEILGA